MEYLKLFDNHAEYEGFVSGETMVRPNVSHCVSENEIHYNGVPYVTVIDVENIVKNSTTDKQSHGMTWYYENSTFNYGTTYSNINPTFHFDGYNPISNIDTGLLEGFYERYVTDEMSDGDNKCYVYRNPSTDEWFFYCNGDRGGSIYWIWAFSEKCDDVSNTFCTKYVLNKAYVRTNVNTPPILPPSIVSVNGVEPTVTLAFLTNGTTNQGMVEKITATPSNPEGNMVALCQNHSGTLSDDENVGIYGFGPANSGISETSPSCQMPLADFIIMIKERPVDFGNFMLLQDIK